MRQGIVIEEDDDSWCTVKSKRTVRKIGKRIRWKESLETICEIVSDDEVYFSGEEEHNQTSDKPSDSITAANNKKTVQNTSTIRDETSSPTSTPSPVLPSRKIACFSQRLLSMQEKVCYLVLK